MRIRLLITIPSFSSGSVSSQGSAACAARSETDNNQYLAELLTLSATKVPASRLEQATTVRAGMRIPSAKASLLAILDSSSSQAVKVLRTSRQQADFRERLPTPDLSHSSQSSRLGMASSTTTRLRAHKLAAPCVIVAHGTSGFVKDKVWTTIKRTTTFSPRTLSLSQTKTVKNMKRSGVQACLRRKYQGRVALDNLIAVSMKDQKNSKFAQRVHKLNPLKSEQFGAQQIVAQVLSLPGIKDANGIVKKNTVLPELHLEGHSKGCAAVLKAVRDLKDTHNIEVGSIDLHYPVLSAREAVHAVLGSSKIAKIVPKKTWNLQKILTGAKAEPFTNTRVHVLSSTRDVYVSPKQQQRTDALLKSQFANISFFDNDSDHCSDLFDITPSSRQEVNIEESQELMSALPLQSAAASNDQGSKRLNVPEIEGRHPQLPQVPKELPPTMID